MATGRQRARSNYQANSAHSGAAALRAWLGADAADSLRFNVLLVTRHLMITGFCKAAGKRQLTLFAGFTHRCVVPIS
jgi:hypothetical protein